MAERWLFDTAPYQPHSETSKEAARKIVPHLPATKTRLLVWLADRGNFGATDEEMAVGLSMIPNSQRPCRIALRDAGLVRDSGRRRPTASGCASTVWVASDCVLSKE